MAAINIPIIKHVGANGQISLGKKYAGKQVSVIECADGTIVLKPGKFVPDSEAWLYADNGETRINKASQWHESSKRSDNYDEIVNKVENV